MKKLILISLLTISSLSFAGIIDDMRENSHEYTGSDNGSPCSVMINLKYKRISIGDISFTAKTYSQVNNVLTFEGSADVKSAKVDIVLNSKQSPIAATLYEGLLFKTKTVECKNLIFVK